MDLATGRGSVARPVEAKPEPEGKRARLLLGRPSSPSTPAAVAPGGGAPVLYPPGYAGIREVTGDIEPEELSEFPSWCGEVEEYGFELEEGGSDDEGPSWDPDAEKPPELEGEDLATVDRQADLKEVTRLITTRVDPQIQVGRPRVQDELPLDPRDVRPGVKSGDGA